jgi:hypothetical protein
MAEFGLNLISVIFGGSLNPDKFYAKGIPG